MVVSFVVSIVINDREYTIMNSCLNCYNLTQNWISMEPATHNQTQSEPVSEERREILKSTVTPFNRNRPSWISCSYSVWDYERVLEPLQLHEAITKSRNNCPMFTPFSKHKEKLIIQGKVIRNKTRKENLKQTIIRIWRPVITAVLIGLVTTYILKK